MNTGLHLKLSPANVSPNCFPMTCSLVAPPVNITHLYIHFFHESKCGGSLYNVRTTATATARSELYFWCELENIYQYCRPLQPSELLETTATVWRHAVRYRSKITRSSRRIKPSMLYCDRHRVTHRRAFLSAMTHVAWRGMAFGGMSRFALH